MANTLFADKDFKPEQLNTFIQNVPQLEEKKNIIRNWQKAIANGKVQKSKEEQIKSEFLDKFFGQVLGYSYESHEAEWNLEKEFKSIADNKKPDAALGFFDQKNKADVRCVIEVKGALSNLDKKQNRVDFAGSPVDQAFAYVPRMPGKCEWVIVTNMIELRLYSRTEIGRYESFQIPELLQHNYLARFFFLLSYQQLFLESGYSKIDQLFHERMAERKVIEKEFYSRYHELRIALFNNLRKEHRTIPPKKLFGLTQKLLDRLLFICFVRDRELLDANRFLNDVQQAVKRSFRKKKEAIWTEMKYFFTAMNEGLSENERDIPEFNGGLFKEDEELNGLHIHDHQLTEIIHFVSSYNFDSQLDVNILGHIFEQSISDIEEFQSTFDEDKTKATRTDKRKKDGIFYTPEYITRYMVKEAVGGWLEDRKKEILQELKLDAAPVLSAEEIENATVAPSEKVKTTIAFLERYREQLKKVKVVDPACGSGAFLNAVFDFLWLEWDVLMKEWNQLTRPWKEQLRDHAVAEPLEVYNGTDEWKIKKAIVANNIYGVDLNPESVEISKLSLWLKTANRKETLADLSGNIKQGNSLIDDPKVAGDDAFDWNHAFAEIMQAGGFDVVVGNPPYVRQELMKDISSYLELNYESYSGKADLYVYFFERGIQILNHHGRLIFITSGKFLEANYGKPLLIFLTAYASLVEAIDFGDLNVFEDISAYPMITHFRKNKADDNFLKYTKIDNLDFSELSYKIGDLDSIVISQENFISNDFKFINENQASLLRKICLDSSSIEKIYSLPLVGVKTGFNEGYLTELPIGDFIKDYVFGKDVKRYATVEPENRVFFPYKFEQKYALVNLKESSILSELKKNKTRLESRAIIKEGLLNKTKIWYEYQQINKTLNFDDEFIIYPNVSLGPNFTLSKKAVVDMTAFIINSNDRYLLSILNSKLTDYLMNQFAISRRGGYLEYKIQYIEKIPIKEITKKKKQPFIDLAEKMLTLHQSISKQSQNFIDLLRGNFVFEPTAKLKKWHTLEFIDVIAELEKGGVKLPPKKQGEWLELFKAEKEKIKTTQNEIDKTDKEIDQLVYALYELTPEEIAIVEKG
ncbi:MAG: Eco57I restriction-modification methylase domain-containing protein [Cytophagales bacterium]|nr:Eco57I restriction-modification methylase domain-containing protein [Cytophagales bacterium]MCA6368334.1 Eco57I restriction-modification methylase domain-containing protein [Cytophagales bacterium]MCA6372658.1 Eco57I restriction-modification methylase domain-containing protein [Cytophagales bacterium]MCA6376267.1 Eco57I restriction-modification methylase domain-containing protein [Cytophagales bacterium]MCA6385308.1 Eco57I restriction-modification methylase domain-containing protein [Cytopha